MRHISVACNLFDDEEWDNKEEDDALTRVGIQAEKDVDVSYVEEDEPWPYRPMIFERAADALEEIHFTGLIHVKYIEVEVIIEGLLNEVDKLAQEVDWLSHCPIGMEEALNSGDGSYRS